MSTYPHVKFLTSAAEAHQLAPGCRREDRVRGRSNSGKSTAINAITQRSPDSRASAAPRPHAAHQFLRTGSRAAPGRPAGLRFRQGSGASALHWLQLMEHYFNVRESWWG
jgi:GTP-binding protein